MQSLLQLFLMPIPPGIARDIHYLNPVSNFIVITTSVVCLFIALLSVWAWHTSEQRRLWFQAEVERRRALIQEANDDIQRKIEEVEEEMARLEGKKRIITHINLNLTGLDDEAS